jgi:cytochrome oxidase Cu insertion factor (SCO1/SenC/PrrC family)
MSESDQEVHQESARERRPQVILWGILGFSLFAVLSLGMWSMVSREPVAEILFGRGSSRLPVYAVVPDFQLVNRNDQPIQRADLWGKIWVADFIFTHCPDECPLMSAEMARLQVDMADVENFRSVSITVDPDRDTPTVLSQYAERFATDPMRWLFLTGEKRAIHHLAREGFRVGIVDPTAGIQPLAIPSNASQISHKSIQEDVTPASLRPLVGGWRMDSWLAAVLPTPAFADHGTSRTPLHTTRFVLVDRQAQIRGYYDSLDIAQLRRLRDHLRIIQRDT